MKIRTGNRLRQPIMNTVLNTICPKKLKNRGLQPPVDKVQGLVGGFVKADFANLKPANLGGETNDNC